MDYKKFVAKKEIPGVAKMGEAFVLARDEKGQPLDEWYRRRVGDGDFEKVCDEPKKRKIKKRKEDIETKKGSKK